VPLSRLRTRPRALWHALFRGPSTFLATLRLQRAVTELAYLRDSMDRGLVDAAGHGRERVLLGKIRTLRPAAVVQPEGSADYPWKRLRRRRSVAAVPAYAPPAFPGPAGLAGSYPAAPGTPGASSAAPGPLGQTATRYSEVDPTWKPPGEQ